MALSTIPPVRQRRPRNSRTKTGCLVCRLRRKKCDEATPTCKNCVRNNLICSWPRTLVHSSSQRRSDLGWRIRLQEGVLDATTRIKAERELRPTDEHLHVTQDILKDDVTSQRLGASKGRLPTPSCSKIWANPSVWEPAIIKTSESQTLLSHFMNETAVQLVAREPQHNPLLSFVLPWAHSETMIMDAMMALGGAHVSHKTGNPALRAATTKHYLSGIRGLKYALTHWNSGAPQATVRLLTVAMLLCQYEAVTCNRRIIAYYHLRASREFISTIFEAGVGNLLSQQREVFGFLLEYYTYMAIVRNITITSDRRMDVVASDWFVQSLQHLQGYQTFGSMLGSSWELYELIPTIPLLQDLDGEPWTMAYLDLEEKIINWSPAMTTRSETPAWVQSSTAVDRIYQIALLTFLYSARYMKNDDKDEFCQKLDPIIIEFRVLCGQLRGSPSRTRLLWPLLVIGSCLSSPEDRQKMCSGLSGSTYDMAITQRAVEILQMTWELDKEGMYGPVALETVVKSHDFCVS